MGFLEEVTLTISFHQPDNKVTLAHNLCIIQNVQPGAKETITKTIVNLGNSQVSDGSSFKGCGFIK